MSYDVLEDRMFYGLKKVISGNTNLSCFTEDEKGRGSEYILVSLSDIESVSPNAGSSTFTGVFNVDYITNSKNLRTIRNQKSKVIETLADNNYYQTSTVSYYFNGTILNIEDGIEDDPYQFRVVYEISHTKVR